MNFPNRINCYLLFTTINFSIKSNLRFNFVLSLFLDYDCDFLLFCIYDFIDFVVLTSVGNLLTFYRNFLFERLSSFRDFSGVLSRLPVVGKPHFLKASIFYITNLNQDGD